MEQNCQNLNLDPKHLLGQLNTARNEINNLRQQIKSLKYIYDKDVDNIKRLLGLCSEGVSICTPLVNSEDQAGPSNNSDDDSLKFKPIGVISTWFPSKRATPRQPGICEKAPGKVTIFNTVFTNPEHALEGLDEFSHMWILFHFHRNDSTHVRAKVSPPRLNGTKTGVFSTRSPHRPCPIGLSLVKITKIERNVIYFEGVDMVDQTPVLDIKPYIPQYDSPLHVEKLRIRQSDGGELESLENTRMKSSEISLPNSDISNSTVDSGVSSLNLTELQIRNSVDVSRDEELALRLQAEEFQVGGTPEFDSPRIIDSMEDRDEELGGTGDVNGDSLDSLDGEGNPEDALSRSSRLLDGADGPSTVCGTDVDLINRRTLTSRLDNSPVRMGIREAPDGEEGFESQSLTPSQTVPNIQTAARIPYGVASESASTASTPSVEVCNTRIENNHADVRVPDWISRPQTSALSVVFHEGALIQMNEILDDKAEEEKRAIENVLKEDPRSVYLRQRWGNQFYTFLIHDLHITCRFDDARRVVTVFQVRHAGRVCECGEPEWQCLGHSPLV